MFYYYLTFSLVLVFLSYSHFFNKNYSNGLFFSFGILFIFLGIRYNFGFDYKMYEQEFFIINFKHNKWSGGMERLEVGWVILNKLFKYVGFKGLIIFHSLIYCFSIFLFIDSFYENKLNKNLALFFILIAPGALLLHVCYLRQSLALSLILFSLVLICKGIKFYFSILLVFLAATFHLSALIFIPIYLVKYLKGNRIVFISISLLSIIFIIILSTVNSRNLIFNIINFLFPKYLHYLTNTENVNIRRVNTGIGLVFVGFNFIFLLSRIQFFFVENKNKIVFISTVLYFITLTISFQYFYFTRILVYFEFFYLLVIPVIYDTIKNKSIRYFYLLLQVMFYMYTSFMFFKLDERDKNYFSEFNVIINNI